MVIASMQSVGPALSFRTSVFNLESVLWGSLPGITTHIALRYLVGLISHASFTPKLENKIDVRRTPICFAPQLSSA